MSVSYLNSSQKKFLSALYALVQNTEIITDSRKAFRPAHATFFALRGKRQDGHDFIPELYLRGVRRFVVEALPEKAETRFPEAHFWHCESSLGTLQALATLHRSQQRAPVVAITGSNGKTMVKEWLAQLLEADHALALSPGSYNSQLGVPLSVWGMRKSDTLGIFEAGISRPHEMEKLAQILKPNIGIFLNLGAAHDAGFLSREEKTLEKMQLFYEANTLIYCRDHCLIHRCAEENLPALVQRFTWGAHPEADLHVHVENLPEAKKSRLHLRYQQQEFSLQTRLWDAPLRENLLHCVALLLVLGYSPQKIQQKIESIQDVPMRLRLIQGQANSLLVDDSYNNDLMGLSLALDFLNHHAQGKAQSLILSDILQSGLEDEVLVQEILKLCTTKNIKKLYFIGNLFDGVVGGMPITGEGTATTAISHTQHFSNTEAFLQFLAQAPYTFANEAVLVKGARPFRLERVVESLRAKNHRTWLEVNLEALAHNFRTFREQLRPETRLLVMVKAFAYGSGLAEVAELLQYHRADYLGVAYADEGVSLRERGIHLPILVLNPDPADFENLVKYNLEPEVYSFEGLEKLYAFCEDVVCEDTNHEVARRYRKKEKVRSETLRTGKMGKVSIHLKLDTGMHRLGFQPDEIERLAQSPLLASDSPLRVKSVLTHLAASDEPEHRTFTQTQLKSFEAMCEKLEAGLGYKPWRHALNTGGITCFPEAQYDMVRLGIGLYGLAPEPLGSTLSNISTLKTTVAQVRRYAAGETVGYGRGGVLQHETEVATLRVGYADGYDRRLGFGKGRVWVRGQYAPTLGSICMDMCMVDVTGFGVQVGDTVELLSEAVSVREWAEAMQTIPYEVLTQIGQRVPRVYVGG